MTVNSATQTLFRLSSLADKIQPINLACSVTGFASRELNELRATVEVIVFFFPIDELHLWRHFRAFLHDVGYDAIDFISRR